MCFRKRYPSLLSKSDLSRSLREVKQDLNPKSEGNEIYALPTDTPIDQQMNTQRSHNAPRQLQSQPSSIPVVVTPTNPNPVPISIGFTISSSSLGPTPLVILTTAAPTVQQAASTSIGTSSTTFSGLKVETVSSRPPLSSTSSGSEALTYAPSPTPTSPAFEKNSAVHSPVFYVTVVILSVVSLAFLVLFLIFLFAYEHRKRPGFFLRRKGRDQGKQDPEAASGTANEPHLKRETSETGSQETVRAYQGNPAAYCMGQTASGYSTPGWRSEFAGRPPVIHNGSTATVRSPPQHLGPLQVNNYVEGDFPSSCDEDSHRSTQPADDDSFQSHGTPSEAGSSIAQRVPDSGDQTEPWAPLKINTDKSARRMVAQGTLLEDSKMKRDGKSAEDIAAIPLPHLDKNRLAMHGRAYDNGNDDVEQGRWGASLRFSLYSTLSGITGGVAKPVVADDARYLPGREGYNNNWIGKLSRYQRGSTRMTSSESQASIEDNMRYSEDGSSGQWRAARWFATENPSSAIQEMKSGRVGEDDRIRATSPISTKPRALQGKFAMSQIRSVDNQQVSERSICSAKYFPSSNRSEFERHARRHFSMRTRRTSTACIGSSLKRRSTTSQSFLRQTFTRRTVSGSITSFSSEASEATTRDLTIDELRAKKIMQSRSRRNMGRDDENVQLLTSTGSPNGQDFEVRSKEQRPGEEERQVPRSKE